MTSAEGSCLGTFEEKKQEVGHRASTYKEGDEGHSLALLWISQIPPGDDPCPACSKGLTEAS